MAQYTDTVYQPDANNMVVASGGTVTVQSGGTLAVEAGAAITRAVTRVIPGGAGQPGATAGFEQLDTGGAAHVPASQTASTYVIPIPWLKIGDTVTGFTVHGQIESAANQVTVDADLRKITSGTAANPVDASVGAITQIDKSADYLIADSKTGLTEVIATTESLYVLLTVTTNASTDAFITGIEVTITEA